MKNLNGLDWVALILVIVGGINWGSIGVFNVDLVSMLFGEMTSITRIVYVLVGLSAVYSLYTLSKQGQTNTSHQNSLH